jgi:hypothetical protein
VQQPRPPYHPDRMEKGGQVYAHNAVHPSTQQTPPPAALSKDPSQEASDWRTVTLPDGRVVEYVTALLVGYSGDDVIADVTIAMTMDGTTVGTERVRFRRPDCTGMVSDEQD